MVDHGTPPSESVSFRLGAYLTQRWRCKPSQTQPESLLKACHLGNTSSHTRLPTRIVKPTTKTKHQRQDRLNTETTKTVMIMSSAVEVAALGSSYSDERMMLSHNKCHNVEYGIGTD